MLEPVKSKIRTIALFMVHNQCTIRDAATEFGISKTAIHTNLENALPEIDGFLYDEIRELMDHNKAVRHIRGGQATKLKFAKLIEKRNEFMIKLKMKTYKLGNKSYRLNCIAMYSEDREITFQLLKEYYPVDIAAVPPANSLQFVEYPPVVYKHYKGPIYITMGVGTHMVTGQEYQIYNDESGNIWARPYEMFHGTKEVDGKIVKRYTELKTGKGN